MLAVAALHATVREDLLTPMWILPLDEIATVPEQYENNFRAVCQKKPWVSKLTRIPHFQAMGSGNSL
jgi:hypothetical protein